MDDQGSQTPPEHLPAPVMEKSLPRLFLSDLIDLLTEPAFFFRERYPHISLSYALAFGVLVRWIASLLDWITRTIRHETLLDSLLKIREKLEMLPIWKSLPDSIWAQAQDTSNLFPGWIAELFNVVASPFGSLFRFCGSGFILFLGGYLLISQKERHDKVDLGHFVKLSALTSAPYLVGSILGFVPFGMSAAIAWVYSIALLLIGLNLRYRISYLRGITILILPGMAMILVLSCFLGVFMAAIGAIFATLFSGH